MEQIRVTHGQMRLHRDELIERVLTLATGSWPDAYRGDVRQCAGFILARIASLTSPTVACDIAFRRVPLASITVTNPLRVSITPDGGYPVLRESLASDSSYDSVPLSVGVSRQGMALWDGHRRFATYRSAGRLDFPAWTATFRRA